MTDAFVVEVEIVGPPAEGADEPRRFVATFAADEKPSDDALRGAIAQTRTAHGFFARVDGEPSAAVIEEINVTVKENEA